MRRATVPATTNGSAVSRSTTSTTTTPTAARGPDSPRADASSMNTAAAGAAVNGTAVLAKIEANRTGTSRRASLETPTARKPAWYSPP